MYHSVPGVGCAWIPTHQSCDIVRISAIRVEEDQAISQAKEEECERVNSREKEGREKGWLIDSIFSSLLKGCCDVQSTLRACGSCI